MPYQLSEDARATTLRAVRAMFPHDGLPDAVYTERRRRSSRPTPRGDASVAATLDAGRARSSAALDPLDEAALRPHDGEPFLELRQGDRGRRDLRQPRGLEGVRLRGRRRAPRRLPRPRLRRPRLAPRPAHRARSRRGIAPRLGGTHAALSLRRRGRRRHRGLRRRRRDARARAVQAGRQGRRAGGGPPPHARRLRQRRVALVQAARLARQPHHVRLVPDHARTSPTSPPGPARRSAARRCTGPAAVRASWSTSSRPRPTTTASTASTRSTGRSRSPTSSRTTTAPRRSWAARARTASRSCRPTTTTRCSPTAPSASATSASTPAATRPRRCPYDGKPATNQDGFNFQGVKDGSKWSTLTVELPRAAATGKLDLRPEAHVTRIEHDDQGLATGVTYVDGDGLEHFQRARLVAVAGNSIETAAAAAQLGVLAVPGRARELLRPGRAQLHAPPDGVGVRDLRPARALLPRRDDGRAHRGQGAATTRPRLRRRLLHAAARARRAVHGRVHGPGRLGPRLHVGAGAATRTWPACGSSARTCRRRPTA